MTTISNDNFNHFLSKKINLSDNVLTEDLGTISRGIFSIFDRISHRNELDSRKICANIETTIKYLGRSLGDAEKEHVIENLSIMTAKFSKSAKPGKADDCQATIERINTFINKKAPITPTPVTPKPSQATVGTPSSRTQSARPQAPKSSSQPASGAIQASQTSIPKSIVKQLDPNALNAQQKLVEAISKRTTKIVPGDVIAESFKADLKRIKEIEEKNNITDYDRSIMPAYGKFTYQNGSYHFMTLKKEIKCSVPVLKYAYIEAEKIEGAIAECKKTSQFDVGALLREQAKKMGIACAV